MTHTTPPELKQRFGGAFGTGLLIAFFLMLMLPISQMLSEGLTSQDRRAEIQVIEPPELMEEPPPPEELQEEEEIEELEEQREPPTLEQLELSMNADVSGLTGGDFTVPSYDIGGGMQDLIFEISQLSVAPRPIAQPAPQYPPELQRNKVSGEVRATFVVRPSGNTDLVRIVHSTNPAFEEPTIRAIRRWRFQPGEKDGEAVSARVFINIPFTTR